MTSRKPTTGELLARLDEQAARIDLLEHALHETRQRADFLTWGIWDLGNVVANHVFVDPFRDVPVGPDVDPDVRADARADAWDRIGLDAVYSLFTARHLEITHLENFEPEDPRVPGRPASLTYAEARLMGARERHATTGGVAGSLSISAPEDTSA